MWMNLDSRKVYQISRYKKHNFFIHLILNFFQCFYFCDCVLKLIFDRILVQFKLKCKSHINIKIVNQSRKKVWCTSRKINSLIVFSRVFFLLSIIFSHFPCVARDKCFISGNKPVCMLPAITTRDFNVVYLILIKLIKNAFISRFVHSTVIICIIFIFIDWPCSLTIF